MCVNLQAICTRSTIQCFYILYLHGAVQSVRKNRLYQQYNIVFLCLGSLQSCTENKRNLSVLAVQYNIIVFLCLGSPWSCTECKRKLGVLAIQKITKEVIDKIGDKRHSSNQELINLIDEVVLIFKSNFTLFIK